DLGAAIGEEAVTISFDRDMLFSGSRQKSRGAGAGFIRPLRVGAKHDPADFNLLVPLEQVQNSTATANLYVIAVCAEAQNAIGHPARLCQVQWKHDVTI